MRRSAAPGFARVPRAPTFIRAEQQVFPVSSILRRRTRFVRLPFEAGFRQSWRSLPADHEDPRVRAEAHRVIGDGKRVEETRALAAYLKRGDTHESELRSEKASAGR